MDSHTNFDPATFGRSASLNILGAGFAVGAAVRQALASAQAAADAYATEMTLQDWQNTVAALRDVVLAQMAKNAAMAREVECLAGKHRKAVAMVKVLEAENRALATLA